MDTKNNLPNSNIPSCILFVLKSGDKYGYEIIQELQKLSDTVDIKQTSLYNILKKLENQEHITSYWKDSDIGGKRHYYSITESGIEYLGNFTLQSCTIPNESTKYEPFDNSQTNNEKSAFWQTQTSIDNISNDKKKPIIDNTRSADYSILPPIQKEKKKSDAIEKSTPIKLSTMEIDYKNILGELYSSETEPKEDNNANVFESPTNAEINYKKTDIATEATLPKSKEQDKLLFQQKQNVANDFSTFGIKVKKHSKASNYDQNDKEYVKIYKINFITSLLIFVLLCVQFGICYWLIQLNNIENSTTIVVFCTLLGLIFLLPLYNLILYISNPNKKSKNEYKFKQTFSSRLIICVLLIVFVLSINLLAGMTDLNQIRYIYYWLIPSLFAINFVLECCIRKLLLKTKKFDA